MLSLLLMFLLSLFSGLTAYSLDSKEESKILRPLKTSVPPVIDGDLADEVWQKSSPLEKDFITYSPMYGEVLSQKTVVWLAYDNDNLYFAFHCFDTEPEKIKTSISKRDSMWKDDWVGISLDSLGNKQSSYEFYSNPNGIQGDILRSSVSGDDLSSDFVWYNAGRLTDDGYKVEMRIPLRSIRFKSGKEVKMSILFERSVSRLGFIASWSEIKPGSGIFNIQAVMVFRDLKTPLNLDVLPSVVYGRNNERENFNSWGDADVFNDYGIGIKYGITSSITADGTINPDFSQVESDVFQVEVNQRYPLFYSEKRPFFMEGASIFNFSTIPYGKIRTAVHTRRIVDPQWAAKLTGTMGKMNFGILAADDQFPGLSWDDEVNPYEGKTAYFTIARGKYSLGGDSYIGGLYSGREFAGGYNRVVGVDFMYRLFTHHQTSISFMQSYSMEPEKVEDTKGSGFNFFYGYDTKPLFIKAAYERYGADFCMDSAFQTRTGINHGWFWIGSRLYPNPKKVSWLKLISPKFFTVLYHDYNTNMNDKVLALGTAIKFIRQGYFNIGYYFNSESWINQTFDQYYIEMSAGLQLTKWLNLAGNFIRGDRIYYDLVNPYLGWGTTTGIETTFQPSPKLSQYLGINYVDFYRKSNNEKIYEVNIVNSRTTYQFNKYFFVRAILQYDSYQNKLLTDFLGSCTIIPGTVLHLGYGALYEKRDWQQDRWVNNGFGYMHNMRRSFFFKASYLWRF